ncbi:MAG TPA: GGDEF domain-containing protein [Acidimicrobiales bacterium]|nr:GGDEF domain-containing protein [Acidimicrobiales bacterium]
MSRTDLVPQVEPPGAGDYPRRVPRALLAPVDREASDDLAPLHRRLGLLQVLRLGLTLAVSAAALLVPRSLGGRPGSSLLALSVVYGGATGGIEMVRRHGGLHNATFVNGLVLLDGLYLATVMSFTGGPQSPLSFLVLVHVIAVTLLLSFRSGLKIALWHALLLFTLSWLQRAGVVAELSSDGRDQAAVVRALALLAVAISAAWFSSLNERELRRGKAELRALTAMAERMAGTREPGHLVEALIDGVSAAFGFSRVAVIVNDKGIFRAFAGCGDGTPGVREVASGAACDGVVGRANRPGLAVLRRTLDGKRDPLLSGALPDAVNVVVIPLVVDGELVGVLAAERGGGLKAQVSRRTVDLLGQFATHAALALRAAALQAEVERLADTDGLTGLANRRVFQLALSRELALAGRRGEPCTLILLDVDHFKAVNDTYGHQAGDEVLRRVGVALADTARGTDVAARYGGEEFAVILPFCSTAEAGAVAERFRAAVAAGAGEIAVTVSAGVATYPRDARDETSLVAAADNALYRAKRTGRDRVVRFRRSRQMAT